MNRQKNPRTVARARRRVGVRKRVRGTDERPRLCVYKSIKYTYAQLISDQTGKVLAAQSTRQSAADSSNSSVESAKILGQKIAALAKEKGVQSVIFDRNGYRYHGRVAAVADGAREGGLQF